MSFIVPVYNVEKYLAECLDSLLERYGIDLWCQRIMDIYCRLLNK